MLFLVHPVCARDLSLLNSVKYDCSLISFSASWPVKSFLLKNEFFVSFLGFYGCLQSFFYKEVCFASEVLLSFRRFFFSPEVVFLRVLFFFFGCFFCCRSFFFYRPEGVFSLGVFFNL